MLFRALVGNRVFGTTPSFGLGRSSDGDGGRLRVFAYCGATNNTKVAAGALTISAVNLDASEARTLSLDAALCGPARQYERYLLEPKWPTTGPTAAAPPRDRVTSREMLLNGVPLAVGRGGELPRMDSVSVACDDAAAAAVEILIPPLCFGFFVFQGAGIDACDGGDGFVER